MVDAAPPPAPDDFAERLASSAPTPGGGAAAARSGLHAASLLRMVVAITRRRHDDGGDAGTARELAELDTAARELADRFRALETRDAAAFEAYLAALRRPRGTEQEKAERRSARRSAAIEATEAPLATMDAALEALGLARRLVALAERIRLRAESDIGGAVELAAAASRTAELNVLVNLPELAEEAGERETRRARLAGERDTAVQELRAAVRELLGA